MCTIEFYEKPGCMNNLLQKALLKSSGHTITDHNILTTKWTPQRLLWFFSDLPVSKWFNRSAPQVKGGQIRPKELTEREALDLLVSDPLLIRRPLMEVSGFPVVGFDLAELDKRIGLAQGRNAEVSCIESRLNQRELIPQGDTCNQLCTRH